VNKIRIRLASFGAALTALLLHTLAWAQEAVTPAVDPKTVTEVVELGKQLIDAAQGGEWGLAIAFGLMIAIWVVRRFFLKSVKASLLPWVAAGLGVLAGISAAVAGGVEWLPAIMQGVFTGTAASGLYSLVGKHLLPKG
jgi:hypothetical protein